MTVKKKYYAVKVGRVPGVYKTWDECNKQVKGYPGALFKGFPSEGEADEYLCGNMAVETDCVEKHDSSGKRYDIYVDGSYSGGRYSWAFVVYDGDDVIFSNSGLGEDVEAATIHNVAGEIAAAEQAIRWAKCQGACVVTIHHDYIGISEWATGSWKTNNRFTQAYAAFVAPYISWVKFKKVSGHSGVAGNELADKLAGEALGRK
ncbi:MAG: ribonuclease H family protein [Negativicutes bacterium]|nr:ribonuclease H family protein [Negativicutes bacterium]